MTPKSLIKWFDARVSNVKRIRSQKPLKENKFLSGLWDSGPFKPDGWVPDLKIVVLEIPLDPQVPMDTLGQVKYFLGSSLKHWCSDQSMCGFCVGFCVGFCIGFCIVFCVGFIKGCYIDIHLMIVSCTPGAQEPKMPFVAFRSLKREREIDSSWRACRVLIKFLLQEW